MSTHSAGPWKLGRCGKNGRQHIDGGHEPEMWHELASVWVMVEGEPSAVGEANARLIVAAPELLHACRLIAENAPAIADWLTANDPAALLQVRAAIAKATGAA